MPEKITSTIYKKRIKNIRYIGLLLFSIIAYACGDTNTPKGSATVSDQRKPSRIQKKVSKDCIAEQDTIFDERNSVRYMVLDSCYDVKVQLEGRDTFLGYKFDCSVPNGLVPSCYAYYQHTLCLLMGSGQNYREFTVCYVHNDRMVIKYFETALLARLEEDLVVYQDYDAPRKIILENIRSGKQKIFSIPEHYANTNIMKISMNKKQLALSLSNGKKISFRR